MGQTVEPVNVNPKGKRNRTVGYGSGTKVSKAKGGKRSKTMKLPNGVTSGIMTPPQPTPGRNGIGR